MNINETDNFLNEELVLSVAEYFMVKQSEASQILKDMKKTVSGWRTFANEVGISRSSQELMSKAFFA